MQIQKQANNTSKYQHFVNCCEILGIKDVVSYLDRMIVIDYIIANEDRHLNNFGAVRNAETLEWMGMAPIYDSGSSLGYDKLTMQIRSGAEIVCKPFKKHHEEQLKLVSFFAWIHFDKLEDVGEWMREIFCTDGAMDYMEESRVNAIVESVKKRIHYLEEFAGNHAGVQMLSNAAASTKDDVEQNVAESYH